MGTTDILTIGSKVMILNGKRATFELLLLLSCESLLNNRNRTRWQTGGAHYQGPVSLVLVWKRRSLGYVGDQPLIFLCFLLVWLLVEKACNFLKHFILAEWLLQAESLAMMFLVVYSMTTQVMTVERKVMILQLMMIHLKKTQFQWVLSVAVLTVNLPLHPRNGWHIYRQKGNEAISLHPFWPNPLNQDAQPNKDAQPNAINKHRPNHMTKIYHRTAQSGATSRLQQWEQPQPTSSTRQWPKKFGWGINAIGAVSPLLYRRHIADHRAIYKCGGRGKEWSQLDKHGHDRAPLIPWIGFLSWTDKIRPWEVKIILASGAILSPFVPGHHVRKALQGLCNFASLRWQDNTHPKESHW